ncbi:MAG: sigma-E factor negative regulatory protein [Lysobacter sp.]
MSTSQIHDAETLSALFDGHLHDDARRFALKRLGHDRQWREACGRWQLAGDALRGNAMAPAPAGFAERVMAAVAHESVHAEVAVPIPSASLPGKNPVRVHRRWIGGAALAASVAMAALFVVRPAFETDGSSPDAMTRHAIPTAPAATDAVSPMPSAGALASSGAGATETLASQARVELPVTSPAGGAELAVAAAVAAADLPRRGGERRARGQSQRAALRGSQSRQPVPATAVASAAMPVAGPAVAATLTSSDMTTKALHPFMPSGEIVSRPWPRATLPSYSAHGALRASYHGAGDNPASLSFYPFGPQALQGDGQQGRVERHLDQAPSPQPTGTVIEAPRH